MSRVTKTPLERLRMHALRARRAVESMERKLEQKRRDAGAGMTVRGLIKLLQKSPPTAKVVIMSEKHVPDPLAIAVAQNSVGGLDLGYDDSEVWLYTAGADKHIRHSRPVM